MTGEATVQPFLKWAGGKRWLIGKGVPKKFPEFSRYIEPFLGGGAVFFAVRPDRSVLSDVNAELINTYCAIRDRHEDLVERLKVYQGLHSNKFYYEERDRSYEASIDRAAQFIYLNRTCWNGLYRLNKSGKFNVPKGTKSAIYSETESFENLSKSLSGANIISQDFEKTIDISGPGDFLFVDPPYTVKHNMNGFVKYNENIFSWSDQERLADCLRRAKGRGANFAVTNADHASLHELYEDFSAYTSLSRASIISGKAEGRSETSEALFVSY